MKTLIVGYGHIGRAFERLCKRHKVEYAYIDKNGSSEKIDPQYDYMLINIPYTENFIKDVLQYIKEYQPKYVIINSTVKVGTTEKIGRETKAVVAHSPVRGVHPGLMSGIIEFVKQVGCDNPKRDGAALTKYLKQLGVKDVHVIKDAKNTELAKLVSTTTYGVQIAWATAVQDLCKEYGCDFFEVYTNSNLIYNEGYEQLNKPYFKRPVLMPNQGGIGGHCITNNAIILKESVQSAQQFFDEVLKLGYKTDDKFNSYDWLYCEYVVKQVPAEQIAKKCNVNVDSLVQRLKNYGIKK